PPPPPPRRSFPSSHGLTTTRSGEVIITSKKEPGFMKKAESEELETQKPQVKLRRTVSEVVRPASTPPIIASAIKDDDDEDRIIAELEVFQRSSPFLPKLRPEPLAAAVCPGHAAWWPNGASLAAQGWKEPERAGAAGSRAVSLPRIVLSEWVSQPPSPEAEPEAPEGSGPAGHGDGSGSGGAGSERAPARERAGNCADVPAPGRLRCRSDGEGKHWASLGILEASPAACGDVPASATQPWSGPSRWWDCAAGRELMSPPVSSKGTCPPGHRGHQHDGEGSGLAAGSAPAKPGGGGTFPDGNTADRGSGAGAEDATAPQVPRSLLCPVPKPRSSLGTDPEQQGSREFPSEHPKAPGRSSLHLPAQGEAAGMESGVGGTPAAGPCPLGPRGRRPEAPSPPHPTAPRSKEIYEGTYRRLDSLEETIRELEITINEISSHVSVQLVFPKELLGPEEPEDAGKGRDTGLGRPASSSCDSDPALHPHEANDAPESPSRSKPALRPKPRAPLASPQSGGVSIPPMKMVNPASRLKQSQQGSPDKSKHIKQRMEYMRIQGQQQVVYP
ncbi:SRCN1 inhibitor, partial [Crypturellus soui]|nr:SRCN1 inhibitor [Crypturellus soui]